MRSEREDRPAEKSPDERRMRAWKAFLAARRAILLRLEEDLRREHGLALSWYDVLLTLNRASGRRLRMHELAASVMLTQSGLSRLVDRLEEQGLVRRVPCPTDRRGNEVLLTDQGRTKLRRAAPTHLRGIQEYFARYMSDEEADTLTDCFERLVSDAADRALPDERALT